MSSGGCESLIVMLRQFDARLQKGDNPGAWTCVVMDDAVELFGTRGLVKIRGAIDGEPFEGALMRSEEHTSELQSRQYLVCRLLLEKNKNKTKQPFSNVTTIFPNACLVM